jgi:hypothetical protein
MNKAFVREPDSDDALCPRCQAIGDSVPASAVDTFVPPDQRKVLADRVYFCPTANCPVAYFDALEGTIEAVALTRAIYPKDQTAPLCGCFGLTLEDVIADASEPAPRRIRELLAKSKSPAAHCATASPNGKCCLPEVQKAYFRIKGQP